MTYTEEEWLNALRECEQKHGEVTPSVFDDDPEFPSYTRAANRFESWSRAKERAGVNHKKTDTCSGCNNRYRHLVKHWNNSECDTKRIPKRNLQILTGLLMSDETLIRDGQTAGIAVGSSTT